MISMDIIVEELTRQAQDGKCYLTHDNRVEFDEEALARVLQENGEEPAIPIEEFLIWSEEHRAWWRPNSAGYTTSMAQAGRYTKAKAEEIVRSANYDRAFNEAIVPLTADMRMAMSYEERGR